MCHPCLSRRSVLRLAGAGAVTLAAGCDAPDIDLVSDETVEAMGLRAWEEISASAPRSSDREMQAALDAVSGRLFAAADERPDAWEVVVFARPDINAFALPGRKIGVYEGMFGVVRTADQLAAIVGHEIGHLQADHGQERMNAEVATNWAMRLVAFLLDLGDVTYAGEIAAALGLGVEYGLVRPYSRRQELEADVLGLRLMAAARYDPEEAVTLWRTMDAAIGRRAPEFLATHPAPAARIEAIRAMIPTL